jgi:hypothetical protein
METLKMRAKVSEGGKLQFDLPSNLTGWEVDAILLAKPPETIEAKETWPTGVWKKVYDSLPDSRNPAPALKNLKPEEVDENGWPLGFADKFFGCITDPKFKRYPQGEPDPVPPFE